MIRLQFLLLGMLMTFWSSAAFGVECMTLTDRPNGSCFETGCTIFCALSAKPESARLSPGFFTEYKDGKLVISGVLPNSPAATAGLQSGDTLLEVDHHVLPFADIKPVWQE